MVGLLRDLQSLNAVGPRSLPEHISILALSCQTALSETSELMVHFLTTSYQSAPFYCHPSLLNAFLCIIVLMVILCYHLSTKTIQLQDRSSGNPLHKTAVFHYVPEGSGSLRKFAFV